MTTCEATHTPSAADTQQWLANFLVRHRVSANAASDAKSLRDRLRGVALMEVVAVLERADPPAPLSSGIVLYRHWIGSQKPEHPQLYLAWFNLGASLSAAGDLVGAIDAYRTSLTLRPDFHFAAINLGTALEAAGQPDAALLIWQAALQTDAARTALHNSRARLLEIHGRLAEAEQEMRRSLLLDPAQPDVIQHFVHVRQKMCAWPVLCNDIPGLTPEGLLHHAGPMATLALTDDIAAQCDAGRDWISRKTVAAPRALCPPEGYAHHRIRLGYISSDFCSHAMGYLITELFERHDRARFEVFGYCCSPDDNSPIRARIIGAFDHFRRIRDLPDDAAAQAIRDDEIDILVDLNGLTSGVRAQVLRARPAPVQATYLGFVGPDPLPELDYMFCDDIVVPPAHAALYRPAPLAIAPNYQANDSRRGIGDPGTRARAGLPDDAFVFCCFSNHYKTTQAMFGAWMDILRRAPGAVLWLVGDNAWARANILRGAKDAGVDPARIVFAARVSPDDYIARLTLADAFLDTFPYNAGTIASDALRMGLPLVTLAGRAFASRMAASLLTRVGAPDGIATTPDDYVACAVRLATSPAAHAAYRARLGDAAWGRTIGDIAAFTAAYETALLSIAKRPPPAAV